MSEAAQVVEQSAVMFAQGKRAAAIKRMIRAYTMMPDNQELAYGLAALLQLNQQTEEARRVLLTVAEPTAEIRALWQELREDTDNPLVSILIPTYNRPVYFELALRSACAQTYTNIEIIVCDNSTDDRTEALMQVYAGNLRVRYVRNRDAKTKADNFRPFEQLAKGEFLQWLMDDDVLVKDKIKKMMACFQAYPAVTLVTSRRGGINEKNEIFTENFNTTIKLADEYGMFQGKSVGRELLKRAVNFIGEPSAVLFRRKDLEHHYWDAVCRGYETISDVVMWLELLEKGDCVIFRDALSYYRRHAEQEGQGGDVVLLSRIEWCRLMQEYWQKRLFLDQEKDYYLALNGIYQEYRTGFLAKVELVSPVTDDCIKRYETVMEQVGNRLNR